MFERFTDRARRVVVLAQEEARLLNHSYIGTEHILLGILAEEEGIGAQALVAQGVDLPATRRAIEEMIGPGTSPPPSHIPFTPRAKKVLEYSLREAIQLKHRHIGTEHLLMGLIREGEGVAPQALQTMGVDLQATMNKVTELLEVEPQHVEPRREQFPSFRGCKHPEGQLTVSTAQGFRTVRCGICGTLVGILPEAPSEAS